MKMKLMLSSLFCLILGISVQGGLKDGLLFYVPFEKNCEPAIAAGSRLAECTGGGAEYVDGPNGKAVKIADGIKYRTDANFNVSCGTVAFWFSPGWDTADKQSPARSLFAAVHIQAAFYPNSGDMFFMTGKSLPQEGFQWDYGNSSKLLTTWKNDQWHHIAIAWDAAKGKKSLYIDGALVKANSTTVIPTELGAGSSMGLGFNAPGKYDELMIWGRELALNEIGYLYARPEKAAAELACDIPAALSAQKTVSAENSGIIDGIIAGVTYYVPFDGTVKPEKANGSWNSNGGETGFRNGIVNQAVTLSGKPVNLDSTGNFDLKRGSLSLWFRPEKGLKSMSGNPALFRAGHFVFSLNPESRTLFFMTGNVDANKTFQWDYSCQTKLDVSWDQPQWHHLAAVWDKAAGSKALYLDGILRSSVQTSLIGDEISPAGEMFIGSNAAGDFDELICWNRTLSPMEIASVCTRPGKVAAALGIKVNNAKTSLPLQNAAETVAAAAIAAPPVKVGLPSIQIEKTIVKPGEIFEAVIPVSAPGLKAYQGKITVVLRDFWMNDCGRQELELSLVPGETKIYKAPFKAARKGIYKIEVNYAIDGKNMVRDAGSFGCWGEPSAPDPDSFFGNHVNSWSSGRYIAQANRLGLTWMRDHNMLQTTWWVNAQPDSGAFAWEGADQLDALKKYNIPALGQLFTTPDWAAASGGQPKKPGYSQCLVPDMNLFSEYVYQTVKHYGNYIKYWEIWNEPEVGMFWKGTPEKFGELVQTAVKAAKKADPNCKIMSAGFTAPPWVWHEKSAKAGAFKGIDLISFHFGCPLTAPEDTFKQLQALANHFQEMAVKYGDGRKLPLWDTEGGTADTTFLRGLDSARLPPEAERQPMNWYEGAVTCVQAEAVHMTLGIEKHFIYLQNQVPEISEEAYINTSMLDVNNAPRPKLMARVAMQEQLDWTVFYKTICRNEGRFWANVHQKKQSQDSVVMLWCGSKGELRLRASWPGIILKAIDIMGNDFTVDMADIKVTGEPLYLHINASAEKVATAIEQAFVKITVEPEKLEIADDGSEHKVPELPAFVAPGENPAANFTVDLRKFCNMDFMDDDPGNGKGGWSDEGQLNDLRDFKTGKRKLHGVTFDVIDPKQNNGKAIITLYGAATTVKMPDAVKNIPVNRKARCLYFLHAAAWGVPGNIGEYVVNFTDGTSETIVINIPQNNNNWWSGYDKKELSRPVPVQVTNTATGKTAWRYLRVFEWENRTGKMVKSIDFLSLKNSQTPILIAISGV